MERDDDNHARGPSADKGSDSARALNRGAVESPPPFNHLPERRAVESDRALVVLDMSLDRCRGSAAVAGAEGIVRFIQGELRYFRERGRLVVFATHEGGVVIPELTPRSDEITMSTAAPSAFFATVLDAALQARGIHRVTLVGVETHTAVLLTAGDALARGYEVVVPDPCVTAGDVAAHGLALRLLRDMWQRAPIHVSAVAAQSETDASADVQS